MKDDRLISLNEALNELERLDGIDGIPQHFIITRKSVRNMLRSLPSAQPKIIRCEKCNFWDRDHISCEGLAKCLTGEGGIRYRSRNDFCSKGKQKDGK